MKIENINITTNLLKATTFIGGVMYTVWQVTIAIVGAQQGIDSRFEQLESKVEIVSIKQTNQDKIQRNDRKRDSANYTNRFDSQDKKLDLVNQKLDRMNPYNKNTLSEN